METPCDQPPPSSSRATGSSSKDEGLQTRDWCGLPKEALHRIALKLDYHTHLPRLRGVCPAWRSSLPYSDFPTTMAVKFPHFGPNHPDLLLFLTRFYLLSPLPSAATNQDGCSPLGGRWLARVGQLGYNKWHLFNPLEIDEYFFPTPPISGYINLLDCQIAELAYVFTLLVDSNRTAKPIAKKIVGGLIWDSTHHFVVLAKLEKENGGGLVLFNLDSPDPQWIPIQEASTLRILDIACHKGKFYALDLSSWRVGLIDPINPLTPMEFIRAPDILDDPIDGRYTVTFDGRLYFLRESYLVSANGNLYLVVEVEGHSNSDKVTMIAFVLKEERTKDDRGDNHWRHINSLGDQIFFIGYDVSFSLPSSSVNLRQWKPNSICLFTRPSPHHFKGHKQGAELLESITYADYWRYFRIFDMGEPDKGVVPFEKLPKQLYTGLFFPPPSWVKWRCPSLNETEFRLDRLKFLDDDYQFFSD